MRSASSTSTSTSCTTTPPRSPSTATTRPPTGRDTRGQRTRLAITWGHNKDHRPDLKQLLYILTVTSDGAVPVHFRVQSGNATDDQTHRATWDLLCKLDRPTRLPLRRRLQAGHRREHGLHPSTPAAGSSPCCPAPEPRTRPSATRSARSGPVAPIHDKRDDEGKIVDQYSVSEPAGSAPRGIAWSGIHSTRKAEQDAQARHQQVERAVAATGGVASEALLRRGRDIASEAKVAEAVEAILQDRGVEGLDRHGDQGAKQRDVPPGTSRPAQRRDAVS